MLSREDVEAARSTASVILLSRPRSIALGRIKRIHGSKKVALQKYTIGRGWGRDMRIA